MTKLNIYRKSGCHCNGPVLIYDHKGILFYSSDWAGGFIGLFNLPVGTYYTKQNVKILKSPLPSPVIHLPQKERNQKIPKSVKIHFGHNPAKATIYHKQNKILFDKSFLTKPLYEIWFIFYHELGHKLYYTEHKADLYAAKRMFKHGFNESQIMLAPFNSLSSKNFFRTSLIIKTVNHASSR